MTQALGSKHCPNLLYLNGDFDVEADYLSRQSLARNIQEMTLWFLPVGGPGDRICLDCDPPRAYLDYLADHEISTAIPIEKDERVSHMNGLPWGWDQPCENRLHAHGASIDHPGLEVVRKVNTSEFQHNLASKLGLGTPGAFLVQTLRELQTDKQANTPLVIKPSTGNAGRGFFFLPSQRRLSMDRFLPRSQGGAEGPILVEPWLDRIGDITTRFELNRQGDILDVKHHRTLCGQNGNFFGCYLDPGLDSIGPWKERLDQVAQLAGGGLRQAGYFGPVATDSFLYRNGSGQTQMAAMVDINARQSVSTIAYSLWEKTHPRHHLLLRSMSHKKHHLPQSYPDWNAQLDSMGYRPDTGTGVLLLTPLFFEFQVSNQRIQPRRSLFCLLERSLPALQSLYHRFIQQMTQSRHLNLNF